MKQKNSIFWVTLCVVFFVFSSVSKVKAAPGDIDPTFGNSGVVNLPGVELQSLTLQADGKIVVAGSIVVNGFSKFFVSRHLPNGSFDAAFGNGGSAIFEVEGGYHNYANSVVVQPDGKIVVTGYARKDGVNFRVIATARLLSNGAFDTTFSFDGKLSTQIGSFPWNIGHDLQIQPDGKIVVAGEVEQFPEGPDSNFPMILRYHPNGSLDSSFGSNGVVTLPNLVPNHRESSFRGVKLLGNGKIVTSGYLGTNDGLTKVLVSRFNSNGTLDSTFGNGGIVLTGFTPVLIGFRLQVQLDGKIVVAGDSFNQSAQRSDIAFMRYNPNGSLDTTLAHPGVRIINTGITSGISSGIRNLAVQSDGKIVFAGMVPGPTPINSRLGIIRSQISGVLDPTFGVGGIAATNVGFSSDIALQPDGKIVVLSFNQISRYFGS